ncbi:hypothetical protein FOZ60_006933 [Perkinsus olseni]|uniref:Uncharacterized protein n=1 Tax=Perkinsus olseni TaxID=32597 RepID=A0A7J6PF87_PEROL|nr:hypothetical protein FOZ60_006933 [Perkinsus olseni]
MSVVKGNGVKKRTKKREENAEDETLLKVDKYSSLTLSLQPVNKEMPDDGRLDITSSAKVSSVTSQGIELADARYSEWTAVFRKPKGGLFGDGTLYEQSYPRYDEAYLGLATGLKPLVLTTAGRKMSRLRADYPRSFAVMEGLQPYGTSKARLFPDDGDLTNPRLLPRAITCTELLSPECAKQLAPRLTGSQERLSGQTRYIGLDSADVGKS